MENPTTIAIDLSKNVFEIAVERQGRVCQRKRLNRQRVAKNRIGNKTDRRDTGAILRTGTDEKVVPVPVKTIEQQTICALHRVRAALMKTRSARLNTVRGLLREFGVGNLQQVERRKAAFAASVSLGARELTLPCGLRCASGLQRRSESSSALSLPSSATR
jgi:transposase